MFLFNLYWYQDLLFFFFFFGIPTKLFYHRMLMKSRVLNFSAETAATTKFTGQHKQYHKNVTNDHNFQAYAVMDIQWNLIITRTF